MDKDCRNAENWFLVSLGLLFCTFLGLVSGLVLILLT